VVEPGQGVYAATKAGTLQMIRALAAELGPLGVRANAVAPGVVETPLTAPIKNDPDWYRAYAEKSALGRWAQPSELVGAVVYLASDAASFVTGSLLLVDGGWTASTAASPRRCERRPDRRRRATPRRRGGGRRRRDAVCPLTRALVRVRSVSTPRPARPRRRARSSSSSACARSASTRWSRRSRPAART
jgi:hypothetical protein